MPSCTAPRLAPHPLTSRCEIGAPPSAHARRWSVARLTASSTSYTGCGAHLRRSAAERRTTDGWIVPSPPPTPLCSIDDAAAALSPFSGGAAKIPSDGGTDRHRPTHRSRCDHREIGARSARDRREIGARSARGPREVPARSPRDPREITASLTARALSHRQSNSAYPIRHTQLSVPNSACWAATFRDASHGAAAGARATSWGMGNVVGHGQRRGAWGTS